MSDAEDYMNAMSDLERERDLRIAAEDKLVAATDTIAKLRGERDSDMRVGEALGIEQGAKLAIGKAFDQVLGAGELPEQFMSDVPQWRAIVDGIVERATERLTRERDAADKELDQSGRDLFPKAIAAAERRGWDAAIEAAAKTCEEFREHVPDVPGKTKAQQGLSIAADLIRNLQPPTPGAEPATPIESTQSVVDHPCLYCGKPTGGRYYYCSRACEKARPESGSEIDEPASQATSAGGEK